MRIALVTLALAACQPTPLARDAARGSPPEQTSAASAVERKTTPQIVHPTGTDGVELREGAPHVARAVDVGNGVTLEVLDWGGEGPALLLLAGLGNSAHIFDDLASAFVDRHVLGLSRRGFGGSTVTEGGYDVPSLGTDILHVLDALHLTQAVFVGHSIAGEELTWLGSEHADRVLGLVYLDAAYDRVALKNHRPGPTPETPETPADLASPLAYTAYLARGMAMPLPLDEVLATFTFAPDGHFLGSATDPKVIQQIAAGVRIPDYTRVKAPTLALYAQADHWTADYAAVTASERDKLARALPSARVQAIPHAKHYLFLTHRSAVVAELGGFLDGLEPSQ